MHDGGISPLPFHKRGNRGEVTVFIKLEWYDCLSRSNGNKLIAAVRAPMKFRIVFYDF